MCRHVCVLALHAGVCMLCMATCVRAYTAAGRSRERQNHCFEEISDMAKDGTRYQARDTSPVPMC